MAIDFPAGPTIGQQYVYGTQTWEWNGTAWQLVLSQVLGPTGPDGKFSTSAATPPSTPIAGEAWFNSDTAKTYVFYDGFWVETGAAPIGPTGPIGVTGPTGPIGPPGGVTSSTIDAIWTGTQVEYDGLGSYDPLTLYVITG